MRTFIEHLTDRGFSGRTVGFIENGSWSPVAARGMRALLEKAKNIGYTESEVRILSSVSDENLREIRDMAEELNY
jgi:flavorubredoxin